MPKMKKVQNKRGKKRSGPYEEPEITRVKLPYKRNGEMFARVIDILGQERMEVFCEDGKHRIGRIRGKIKKRVWVRKGDLVIINPWNFETLTKDQKEKCEISWRFLRNEVSWLHRNNKLPEILQLDNIPI